MSEVSYATWAPETERYLRGRFDDVYTRPMFEIIDDEANDESWENGSAARWNPDRGWASPADYRIEERGGVVSPQTLVDWNTFV